MYQRIATRRLPGDVVEIIASGEIDLANANELREAIAQTLVVDRPALIRVDLAGVSFIDSVAVGALVAGYQTAAVSGVRVIVTNPSEFVYRTLYVSGVVGLFAAPSPRTGAALLSHEPTQPVSG